MKKLCGYTISIFVCLILLFGCNKQQSYAIYELSNNLESNGIFNFTGEVYPFPPISSYIDENAIQEKTITFNNKTYSLKYNKTEQQYMVAYEVENYCDINDSSIEFDFKKGTDELVYFQNIVSKKDNLDNKKIKNESDYRKFAEVLLAQYINVESYNYECRTIVNIKTEKGIENKKFDYFYKSTDNNENLKYEFTYNRYIDGYPVGEYAKITINDTGKIMELSLVMIGKFDNILNINIDKNRLKETINNKLETICDKTNYTFIDYTKNREILIKDKNNKLLVLTEVAPEVKNNKTGEKCKPEKCMFIVDPKL